jgi:hypothetical protein
MPIDLIQGMHASIPPAGKASEKKTHPFLWIALAITSVIVLGLAVYILYSVERTKEPKIPENMTEGTRVDDTTAIRKDLESLDLDLLGSELKDIKKEF